jgi:hypothetical protein
MSSRIRISALVRRTSRLWARHRMIVSWRRPGVGVCRSEQCGAWGTLDLAPQIARACRGLREHSRGVLELRAGDLVATQHHAPARVLHRGIERGIGLYAAKLTHRGDECGIRHAKAGRTPAAATTRDCADEGDGERQPGAYHAGKARHEQRRGQRCVMLACSLARRGGRPKWPQRVANLREPILPIWH